LSKALILSFTSSKEWRKWLEKNHTKEKEAWLTYYKQASGKPSISYDESVEEAICFGWIDNRVKRIDDEKFVRRFVPRLPVSAWSKFNIDRAKKMVELGKMTEAGLAVLPSRFSKRRRV
jgi:uncharacterized protein YdeI (YjbR/CyaY-like superfamily)